MRTKRKSSGERILRATRQNAFKAVADGVAVGEQIARQRARVDTGYMQEHVVGESDGQGHGKLESDVSGESEFPYDIANEFGTSKMAAQPFFRPGRDAAIQHIRGNMRIVKG